MVASFVDLPPQELQECGKHMAAPTLRPVAVRIVLLDIRAPVMRQVGHSATHQTQVSLHLSAEILRRCQCSGPEGCRKCGGLMADSKISVHL